MSVDTRPEGLRACTILVASRAADFLAKGGITGIAVDDLVDNAELRGKEFGSLGLNSLDWMALATQLETETGVELTDEVLIDPKSRSVAGWAECLYAAGAVG